MITVDQAKRIIADRCTPLAPVRLPLHEADGLVLAEALSSPSDVPAFDQSSVDGYALRYADYCFGKILPLQDESAAGTGSLINLDSNKTVRIFTGAPIPQGADTVIMQEKVAVFGGGIRLGDQALKEGEQVRKRGSEIRSGMTVLPKGSVLNPGAMGYIASTGCSHVLAYPKPRVSVLVTGSELRAPGKPLSPGQIYESNSFALSAALKQYHFSLQAFSCAPDDLEEIKKQIDILSNQSDVLLITGGVSVGTYDLTPKALESCGFTTLFHSVRQKPGKPLYMGSRGKMLAFGLPGNPGSVLTCFYQYVIPALEQLSQRFDLVPQRWLPLSEHFSKPKGLTYFIKGQVENPRSGSFVKLLPTQESFRMSGFAVANALVELDSEQDEYAEGAWVKVYLL